MLTHSSHQAPDGLPFTLITLSNSNGMSISVLDWGATWVSCRLPLPQGETRELLLGCATPAQYVQQQAYLGSTLGRYANRIANAHLNYQGQSIPLAANEGPNQLHGGPDNFSQRRWSIVEQSQQQVTLQLRSADGDQGFPGNLSATVCYRLTEDNHVIIEYQAEVDRPCPVNITNHAYFNLDEKPGSALNHHLQLFADHYLPTDLAGLPCAPLCSVAGSGMDFRQRKPLSRDFLQDDAQKVRQGYDHGFLLQERCRNGAKPAAILTSADGKVELHLYTTLPALHLYSGNFLAATPNREGGSYDNYAGIALESEFLPDSPNHPEWLQPDCWLQPGELYQH
ncbi:MAG: galactose-1-epimerase, partial [Enterobacteriaceae bacterium]